MTLPTHQLAATDQTDYLYLTESGTANPAIGKLAADFSTSNSFYAKEKVALTTLNSVAAFNDLAAITTAHTDNGVKGIGRGWYRWDRPDVINSTAEKVSVNIEVAGCNTVMLTYNVGNLVGADANNRVDVIKVAGTTQTAGDLATLVTTVDTVVDTIKASTDKLDDTVEDNAGTYRFTEAALSEGPSGGGAGLSAQETRDAMLLAPTAPGGAAGSIDAMVDGVEAAAAAITTSVDTLEASAATVIAATDSLESVVVTINTATGTTIPNLVDTLEASAATIISATDSLEASLVAGVNLTAAERAKLRGYSLSGTTLTFPEGATATVVITDGQIVSVTPV